MLDNPNDFYFYGEKNIKKEKKWGKKKKKKKKNPPARPFSRKAIEDNQTIFFFWPYFKEFHQGMNIPYSWEEE